MPITNIQVLLFGVQLTCFTAEVHFSCFTDHKEIYEDEFHCQYDILQHNTFLTIVRNKGNRVRFTKLLF